MVENQNSNDLTRKFKMRCSLMTLDERFCQKVVAVRREQCVAECAVEEEEEEERVMSIWK